MISSFIALPYELARLPLVLVDDTLAARLPETSPPRVALDRVLGSADKLVGALLSNREIAARGATRIERSERLRTVATLEREADQRREQARETAAEGRREAADKRRAAQDRAESGLAEADAAEARGKEQVRSRAQQTAAAKRAAADARASTRTASVEERQDRAESAVEGRRRAAQRKAEAELDDARETQRSAREARSDAERLSGLTEAKKQARTQD